MNQKNSEDCGCHKLLLLGDAAAKVDDDSIYHAIETQTNISRYLSFEQATAGMMAMRLLCLPHHSPQSVFPHDCAYLRDNLFANIHKDHPIYWGLSGAKRALANCNGQQSHSNRTSSEERPIPSKTHSQPPTKSRPSSEFRPTEKIHKQARPTSNATPQQTCHPTVVLEAQPSMPSVKLENYEPSTLEALIIDYKNPVKLNKRFYYPGPASWADGISPVLIEEMSYRRIERIRTTSYKRLQQKAQSDFSWLILMCKFTSLKPGQEGKVMDGAIALAKFIYCQNAGHILVEYLKDRATRVDVASDNLFKRYPLLMKLLPSNISSMPREQIVRTQSSTGHSLASQSQNDYYESCSETTSDTSSDSYVSSESDEEIL